LLDRERGVRNVRAVPRLTEARIARWAKAHYERTGEWPGEYAGPIQSTRGEVWANVNQALRDGTRGLPGGDTLAKYRGKVYKRKRTNPPRLTVRQRLAWADARHACTGKWPRVLSGAVVAAPLENWQAINMALYAGLRGLRGGDSLVKLLQRYGRRKA
jgi:hypothetical protein